MTKKPIFFAISMIVFMMSLQLNAQQSNGGAVVRLGQKISKETVLKVMEAYAHEPTIEEVQKKAIEYARSESGTKDSMLLRARTSGLLPRLTVTPKGTFDRDTARRIDPDADTATTETYTDGNQAYLNVAMRWDLNHLIYHNNEHQIQKVGIQIGKYRERIINQVTRRYYERRKLQIELELDPPKKLSKRLDKELRLQELTANIDALTGRWFSEELSKVEK